MGNTTVIFDELSQGYTFKSGYRFGQTAADIEWTKLGGAGRPMRTAWRIGVYRRQNNGRPFTPAQLRTLRKGFDADLRRGTVTEADREEFEREIHG